MAVLVQAILLGRPEIATAQTGPFPPENWPTTRDASKRVHYVSLDDALSPPGATWEPTLSVLTGGDQVTQDITIGGYRGKKVTGSFLNIADSAFTTWADVPFIDILVQVYGDAALFNAQGNPRNFNFLTGTLPELASPNGGQIPVEARNRKWNWVLFRIPNGVRPSDGTLRVGSIPANAQGGFQNGGVNGGTIRMENVGNLIVRTIAFGEEGAFGTPEDINKFLSADACEPEPATNLAGIDVSANRANKIQILNNLDQTVVYETGIGPVDDKRRAVKPTSGFLNFAILDNYLGRPCNDPQTVKVCVEFYDDPAFEGQSVRFGPHSYATDDQSGMAELPESARPVLAGSGKWIRRSWVVPAVNLKGVNAGALTAGPRFSSEGAAVAVSNFQIAILRGGTHPLAGQDPLSDCYADPLICTGAYGSYAELDLSKDLKNGLDVGTSGGDQQMIVEEAGPAGDRRMAVRAALDDGTGGFPHIYLNFAITGEALGPNSQPPARLAIVATYYDDPELAGRTIRPEVYTTERNGSTTFGFAPTDWAVALEGSGTWKDAYWEIPDMKFNGVNQGPQAAARFVVNGKIFVGRLRYAVIRPCGPNAGQNPLEAFKPRVDVPIEVARLPDGRIRLAWDAKAAGFVLQSTATLGTPWENVADAPVVDGERLTVAVPVGTDGARFYRLTRP